MVQNFALARSYGSGKPRGKGIEQSGNDDQGTAIQDATDQAVQSEEAQNFQRHLNYSAEGYDKEKGAYSLRKKVDVNNAGIMTQIAVFSSVATGADIPIHCKQLKPDVYVYLAGSLLFLGGMIVSQMKLKEANKKRMQNQIQLTGKKTQDLNFLEQMKEGEEGVKTALEWKKGALIVYEVALVLSAISALLWATADATQKASFCSIAWLACFTFEFPLVGAMYCYDPTGGTVGLVSDAIIGFLVSQTGSTAVGTAVGLARLVYKKFALRLMQSYVFRTIYYGASAIPTTVDLVNTIGKAREAQGNIEDIEKMIKEYRTHGQGAMQVNWGKGTHQQPLSYAQANEGGGGSSPDYGEEVLKRIKKVKIPKINLPQGVNSPTLSSSVKSLNSAMGAMQSGSYETAMAHAHGLGKNLSKLKKIRDDLYKKVNERMVKAGKKPINFQERAKKEYAKLQRQIENEIKKSQGQPTTLATLSVKDKKKAEREGEVKKLIGSDNKGEVALDNTDKKEGFEFGFDEEMDTPAVLGDTGEQNPEESLDDYILEKNDIHKNSSQSIFKVLSARYIKTAYPKLFEEVPIKN